MKYLVAIDIWKSKITVNGKEMGFISSEAKIVQPTRLSVELEDGTMLEFDNALNTENLRGLTKILLD